MDFRKKIIKIAILEDNDFYNKMITRRLTNYTSLLSLSSKYQFDIQSYTRPIDFMKKIDPDLDMAFVDYYLGDGITAKEILPYINKLCRNCKTVVTSKVQDMNTAIKPILSGATTFILKDKEAPFKYCLFIENEIRPNVYKLEQNK